MEDDVRRVTQTAVPLTISNLDREDRFEFRCAWNDRRRALLLKIRNCLLVKLEGCWGCLPPVIDPNLDDISGISSGMLCVNPWEHPR